MKIDCLFFASLAQAVGATRLQLELPDAATAGNLVDLLESRYPELCRHGRRYRVAVDGEFASLAAPLRDGCEVALLPPVSGGATP